MIKPIYILTTVEIVDYDRYFDKVVGGNWRDCYREACKRAFIDEASDPDNLLKSGLLDGDKFVGETPESGEEFYRSLLADIHDHLAVHGSGNPSYDLTEHLFAIDLDTGSIIESHNIPDNTEQYISSLEAPCKEQDG